MSLICRQINWNRQFHFQWEDKNETNKPGPVKPQTSDKYTVWERSSKDWRIHFIFVAPIKSLNHLPTAAPYDQSCLLQTNSNHSTCLEHQMGANRCENDSQLVCGDVRVEAKLHMCGVQTRGWQNTRASGLSPSLTQPPYNPKSLSRLCCSSLPVPDSSNFIFHPETPNLLSNR